MRAKPASLTVVKRNKLNELNASQQDSILAVCCLCLHYVWFCELANELAASLSL